MKNIDDIKILISKAYAMLPEGHAYYQAKSYLKNAFAVLEKTESKQAKKQQRQIQENEEMLMNNPYLIQNPMAALDLIDRLIAEEKEVLRKAQEKGKKTDDDLLTD